jgi:ribosome-binding protein aMBF1 (putative translation factor)
VTINLAEERLNRGLSVRALAKEIKVNPQVVQRAEEGRSVHPASAKKIADFYGYRVTDIWPLDEKAGVS